MDNQQTLWNRLNKVGTLLIVIGFAIGQYISWQDETPITVHPAILITQLLFIGLLLSLAYRYWSNLFSFLLSE
ncbi:MAG: hypothetical protein KDE51_16950 [Anaerolineales bacterium]|nr:hypothetical protein [Anaerolineales bacterium]